MEIATHSIEDTLNRLIEVCREGQQGYKSAAQSTKQAEIKSELELYSRQRGDFAEALGGALSAAGGAPTAYGAVQGVPRRGWLKLETPGDANVRAVSEESVVGACEQGEQAARQAYFEAMNEPLPAPLKALITEQFRSIETVYARIRSLRETASNCAAKKELQGNGARN